MQMSFDASQHQSRPSYIELQSTDCCSRRRGVAQWGKSRPLPDDTLRQIWGAGVRAGMYPLTENTAYWFICFNADEVGGLLCCYSKHLCYALGSWLVTGL